MKDTRYYQDQTIGSIVDIINNLRIKEMNREILKNLQEEKYSLNNQYGRFLNSLEQIEKVRNFLKTPENILGSNLTKHGEVAENIEVHVRNAKSLLENELPKATFDGVGRTAPEDYLISGYQVQSKFYNGINNTLEKGVLEHMQKYDWFGRDSSYYHIPKDQFKIISEIQNGNIPDELSQKLVNKITKSIQSIEELSGRPFAEVVKPSMSNYNEVQLGVAFKTVDGHEEAITLRNEEIKGEIKTKFNENEANIISEHQPSFSEVAEVGLYGAMIGGGFSVALNVYKKYRDGKKLTDFSSDDWKSVGVDFTKGGAKGAISGVSIYSITNFTDVGAPVASAFVSTIFGIAELSNSYKNGDISQDEFINQGQILCIDSSAVALGATTGQLLIPIPIVGALVGTFASKMFMSISKEYLGKETEQIQQALDMEYKEAMRKLDIKYQNLISSILKEYEDIEQISKVAFSIEANASLASLNASIKLAQINRVENSKILTTIKESDDYFLS